MSFSLKIRKTTGNTLREIVTFHIWQRITFMDSSEEITEIFPLVIPLNSTAAKMKGCQVMYKQRVDRYLLYNIDLYNEFGNSKDRDIHGDYYFQFKPPLSHSAPLSSIQKIEYSTDSNFPNTLTNTTFQKQYAFKKKYKY